MLIERAIENQIFMMGVNRIEVDGNDLAYVKGSLAEAPNEEIVPPVLSIEGFDVYDVDETKTGQIARNYQH